MAQGRNKKFEDWLCKQQGVFPKTALSYVVESLIPYTEDNFKLAFKPNAFFNELDKIGDQKYSRETLRKAYYEAKRRHLISQDDDGRPILSDKAKHGIKPFKPTKLKGACLMVIFDIPETERRKRQWLRLLLKELHFKQLQQSVWVSDYECREILSAGIIEQRLEKFVRVFESRPIES